jgi:hypothetical protein
MQEARRNEQTANRHGSGRGDPGVVRVFVDRSSGDDSTTGRAINFAIIAIMAIIGAGFFRGLAGYAGGSDFDAK